MADDLLTPFMMHGAREALDAGAVHLEQQIVAIEEAVSANPGLTFDLSKTLLESVCKTVLYERSCDYDGGWDLPRLLKETLAQLRLVPVGLDHEQEVSDSLRKTTGGLQTTIQGICELRNTHGFASHGKDPSFHQLEAIQALLVARSADVIVNFLFRIHQGYPIRQSTPVIAYEDHPAFNGYVDEAYGIIKIFETQFRPSDILFQMEPETYRIALGEFEADLYEEKGDQIKESTGKTTP